MYSVNFITAELNCRKVEKIGKFFIKHQKVLLMLFLVYKTLIKYYCNTVAYLHLIQAIFCQN